MSVYTLLSCASSRIMTEYLDSKKSCKILLEIMTHKHTLDTITKFHKKKKKKKNYKIAKFANLNKKKKKKTPNNIKK